MLIPIDIEFQQFWKKIRQTYRFKACLHPDRQRCRGKIIDCHSIQRSRYLRNIADGGEVVMFDYRSRAGAALRLIGIKKATTFNGFCGYHDKTVFQAIEDSDSKTFSERQSFLFAYRAFAREFAAKMLNLSVTRGIHETNPLPQLAVRNNILGERDAYTNKGIFERALLTKDHGAFVFRQRLIRGWHPLALSGLCSVDRDLSGNLLYNTYVMTERVPLLTITSLPSKEGLIVIVSHFARDARVYQQLIEEVFAMADDPFLQVLSYWTLTFAENWAIAPSLERSWSPAKRHEIERWFHDTIGSSKPYLEFVARIGSFL